MKNFTRTLFLLCFLFVYQFGISQCPDLAGTFEEATTPAACDDPAAGVCEYFVISLENFIVDGDPETIDGYQIIGSVANIGDPIVYLDGIPALLDGDCYAYVPVCYDLAAVQALVQNMNDNTGCCALINAGDGLPDVEVCTVVIDPNGDGLGGPDGYSSGADVQNMTDLVAIFASFGVDQVSIPSFTNVANTINDSWGLVGLGCTDVAANFSSIAYCINSGGASVSPLSIELTELAGQNMANGNKLTWTTQTELNNEYFVIEKSKDGNTFHEIGIVEGAGNSNSEIAYEFMDDKVNGGLNYYRVSGQDYLGIRQHSNVIAIETVNSTTLDGIDIVPNPVRSSVNLSFDSDQIGEAEIMIIDGTGKMVANYNIDVAAGYNEMVQDLSELSNGLYMAVIRMGSTTATEKFLKL